MAGRGVGRLPGRLLLLMSAGCFDFDGLLARRPPGELAVADPTLLDAGAMVPADAADTADAADAPLADLAGDDSGPIDQGLEADTDLSAADLRSVDLTADDLLVRDLLGPPSVRDYPTSRAAADVRIADVNGDGHPDLVLSLPGAASLKTLLNQGDGSFTLGAASPLPAAGAALAALVDYDGDGRLDAAVVGQSSGKVYVAAGRGDGTFAAADTYDPGCAAVAIEAARLDANPLTDLMVACPASGEVATLLGAARGTFVAGRRISVGKAPSSLALGDLDGNGTVDGVVVDVGPGNGNSGILILAGRGDGSFDHTLIKMAAPHPVVLADIDGDQALDLVYASAAVAEVVVLRNLGKLSFAAPVASPHGGKSVEAVAVGDLDGDGRSDVAGHDTGGAAVRLLRGTGNLRFAAAVARAVAAGGGPVRVGDLDGDRRADVATLASGLPGVTVVLRPL